MSIHTFVKCCFAMMCLFLISSCFYLLRKTDSIRFSHTLHIEMDVECLTCHEGIVNSEDDRTSHIPEMDVCGGCHDEVEEDCSMCHPDPENPLAPKKTPTALNFSHKFHLEEGVDECIFCHGKVKKSISPLSDKIPKHEDCFQCHHEDDYNELLCYKCHRNLGSKELKPVSRFSHRAGFLKKHKEYATKDKRQILCAQCHMEGFCMDCHGGRTMIKASDKRSFDIERNFIHRGEYQSRHFLDARRDPSMCVKCHSIRSFCRKCHSRKGVALDQRRKKDMHPADFLRDHGKFARRRILTCVACHDRGKDTNCIVCHSIDSQGVVGPGGNPHPRGFSSRLSKTKDEVCRRCHKR